MANYLTCPTCGVRSAYNEQADDRITPEKEIASDLLTAVKELLEHGKAEFDIPDNPWGEACTKARAAIAKAEAGQ